MPRLSKTPREGGRKSKRTISSHDEGLQHDISKLQKIKNEWGTLSSQSRVLINMIGMGVRTTYVGIFCHVNGIIDLQFFWTNTATATAAATDSSSAPQIAIPSLIPNSLTQPLETTLDLP